MTKTIVMDELHLTVLAPAGLPERHYRAMQRTLRSQRLLRRLLQAARGVLGRHRSLHRIRITLSR